MEAHGVTVSDVRFFGAGETFDLIQRRPASGRGHPPPEAGEARPR
jgi:hypothetical protein